MSVGRLLLAWLVGTVVATVAGVLGGIATVGTMAAGSLALVIGVQVLLGVTSVLLGVAAAVLLWTLRQDVAAAAPWWHWLVVGLPVVLVVALIGEALRIRIDVTASGSVLATLVLELLLGAGLAIWLGTGRSRAARASLDSTA